MNQPLNLTTAGLISILQASVAANPLGTQSPIAVRVNGVDYPVTDVNLNYKPNPAEGTHLVFPFIQIVVEVPSAAKGLDPAG